MTHPDHLGHLCQLLPSMHFQREVAGTFADGDHVLCGDHHLDLGNDQSVDRPAVDNAGDSVPQIAADDCIDHESLQSCDVHQKRWLGIHDFHKSIPQREAGNNSDTKVPARQYFLDRGLENRFRAAPCVETIRNRRYTGVVT